MRSVSTFAKYIVEFARSMVTTFLGADLATRGVATVRVERNAEAAIMVVVETG